MLSKAKIKWINSLSMKKNRDEEGVFIAEGIKLVSELLGVMNCRFLAYTDDAVISARYARKITEKEHVTADELGKISLQKSPQGVFAVFEKPKYDINFRALQNQLSLALDDVQDPGNLGTIIRLADWFGVRDVFCSLHTADVYNPKTIQATMGAIARVRVHYVDLAEFLKDVGNPLNPNLYPPLGTFPSMGKGKENKNSLFREFPIYGTLMDGKNLYEETLTSHGIIVMGNEGNGISPKIQSYISKKLLIPSFPPNEKTSESLNVGIATAITVAEFRRRK